MILHRVTRIEVKAAVLKKVLKNIDEVVDTFNKYGCCSGDRIRVSFEFHIDKKGRIK
jgi:hypothetical protein